MSLEEKQFKIARIDRMIDNLLEDWKEFHISFNALMEEILAANKREKNPLLAVCGVFLTIIFGLASIQIIDTKTLEFYLFVDAGVAVAIFLGYGIYTWSLTNVFRKSASTIIYATATMSGHRIMFNEAIYDITKINSQTIDEFFLITPLLEASIKIKVRNELLKMANMKRIGPPISKELKRITGEWDRGFLESGKIYQQNRDKFDKEYWKSYQPYLEELKNSPLQTSQK